nr:hypothetical protein [Tanacetum cinerariifolium]
MLKIDFVMERYLCKVVVGSGMERGFLSQKGSGGGRSIKEKNANVSNIEVVKEKGLNDEPVVMEVQIRLVDQTNAMKTLGGSYPPLPTQGTTSAGNTLGKSSYANLLVNRIRRL